jgi:hypothetical protein
MAEMRALGRAERFDWFDDDHDTSAAVDMVDAIVADGGFDGDVFDCRHWVEVRARSLLVTKWRAVEALAAKLRKSTVLTGDEVVEICRREGVARLGEKARRTAQVHRGPHKQTSVPTAQLRAELAGVDRQIAEIKAQLDQDDGDDPAVWPLRRKLVGLYNMQRELLDQLEGGTHR